MSRNAASAFRPRWNIIMDVGMSEEANATDRIVHATPLSVLASETSVPTCWITTKLCSRLRNSHSNSKQLKFAEGKHYGNGPIRGRRKASPVLLCSDLHGQRPLTISDLSCEAEIGDSLVTRSHGVHRKRPAGRSAIGAPTGNDSSMASRTAPGHATPRTGLERSLRILTIRRVLLRFATPRLPL
jgi:hypothetical protein